MGQRRRKGRAINGILLFDKPVGMTSNAALQKVKWLYQAAKAGHTGSLDPLAEGLLPICFGEGTKVSAFLLDADKVYLASVKLGSKTTTGDAEGEVIEQCTVPILSQDEIQQTLASFVGEQLQLPPMFSALKHDGKRLYDLARAGIEVERKPRKISIFSLQIIDYKDNILKFSVHCSKGTYVRTLAEDIASALNCLGHIVALRRTRVGPFDNHCLQSLPLLEELADKADLATMDALLLPIDSALLEWPSVRLDAHSSHYLRQGNPVLVPKAPTQGLLRVYDHQNNFLGVADIDDDGRVAPKRLMIA
jgi:tRNA pseudouridine55 synthase